jgi:hypothetical protein
MDTFSVVVGVYAGGLLVLTLNLREAGTLTVGTFIKTLVWPVEAVSTLYEIVAPATSAVVGYITSLVTKLRGK